MNGLDTNVLIRYLTLDDATQGRIASGVFDRAAASGELLFITSIVLCEVVWVLESAYGYARAEVELALDAVLRTAQLSFSDKDVLWQALGDYRNGRGDFADYLIGRQGVAEGCESTLTFDRDLSGSALFEVLSVD